jgi:membrane-associated phospholipid phosphatase
MEIFIYNLPETLKNIVKIKNITLIFIGFLLTYILVVSEFDWNYFIFFQKYNLRTFIFPAIIGGMFLPIFSPALLFIYGKIVKNQKVVFWGGLTGQAAFLGWFLSSFLKSLTGRIQPNTHDLVNNISGGFNFGFWQHGIFWGWPSSHTTVAFSVTFAIIYVLAHKKLNGNIPFDRKIILAIFIVYAFYVGASVSISIHWFSDFIMGAILGFVIGREVGNSYKKIYK